MAVRSLRYHRGLAASAVAYVGDDLSDLSAMREAAFSAAPADAAPEVRRAVYVRVHEGRRAGRGARGDRGAAPARRPLETGARIRSGRGPGVAMKRALLFLGLAAGGLAGLGVLAGGFSGSNSDTPTPVVAEIVGPARRPGLDERVTMDELPIGNPGRKGAGKARGADRARSGRLVQPDDRRGSDVHGPGDGDADRDPQRAQGLGEVPRGGDDARRRGLARAALEGRPHRPLSRQEGLHARRCRGAAGESRSPAARASSSTTSPPTKASRRRTPLPPTADQASPRAAPWSASRRTS